MRLSPVAMTNFSQKLKLAEIVKFIETEKGVFNICFSSRNQLVEVILRAGGGG